MSLGQLARNALLAEFRRSRIPRCAQPPSHASRQPWSRTPRSPREADRRRRGRARPARSPPSPPRSRNRRGAASPRDRQGARAQADARAALCAVLRDSFRRRGVNRYLFASEGWVGKAQRLSTVRLQRRAIRELQQVDLLSGRVLKRTGVKSDAMLTRKDLG